MRPESSQEPDEHRAPDAEAREDEAPEDRPDEPGAEGGSESPTKDKLPGMPAKDDQSPLGDTDQHSTG
jgi:hypothetical protein